MCGNVNLKLDERFEFQYRSVIPILTRRDGL